jgi:predicted small secreted protein
VASPSPCLGNAGGLAKPVPRRSWKKISLAFTFKDKSMKITIFASVIVSLTVLLSGCNTVKGVGQDVQKAGSVLENAAKK